MTAPTPDYVYACNACLDTGYVCEDHTDGPCPPGAEFDPCSGIGVPCPACCSPIPEDGLHSIRLAFIPDLRRPQCPLDGCTCRGRGDDGG